MKRRIAARILQRWRQDVEITATQRPSDTDVVEISITSLVHGSVIELVRCKVFTSDGKDWATDANSNAYLYQSRMDLLGLFLTNGQALKLSQSEVLSTSSNLSNFDNKFQGIQEVFLSLGTSEAVAKIILPSSRGTYVCNPQWLDTLILVASLVVNYGRTAEDLSTCRAWSKLHILLPFEPDALYRVHVRMQPCSQTDSMIGNLHVLNEAGCVAADIKAIQFKPVSSFKVDIAPPTPSSPTKIKLASGAAVPTDASGSQTPKLPRATGSVTNGLEASYSSEANGFNHDAPVTDHSKSIAATKVTNSIAHDFSREKRSEEVPQLNNAVPDKTFASIPTSPKPVAKQLHDGGDSDPTVNFEKLLAVMGEEIGVEPDSLTDNILLEDLGIDSIIQISLIARLQEHLAKPLPQGFLLEFNNIAKLRRYFCESLG